MRARPPWLAGRPSGGAQALADRREERGVLRQLALERALEARVDLADAALGHAEHVADLAQRHVVDVEHHGHLALALGQALEGAAEAVLGLADRRGVLGIHALV